MTTAELFKDIQLLVLEADGVMTDGRAWQDASGRWRRNFSVRDSIGLRALMKAGVTVAVLTEGDSVEIREHVKSLGILEFYENCIDKVIVLDQLMAKHALSEKQIALISENVADVTLFRRLGVGMTVDGADEELQSSAQFVTTHRGGDGAILEICNLIMQGSGRLRGSERAKPKPSVKTGAGGPSL